MAAPQNPFWAKLDEKLAASAAHPTRQSAAVHAAAEVIPLAADERPAPTGRPLAGVSDWTGILDIINEAGERAKDQEIRLQEQAVGFQGTIQELRGEVQAIQQQVHVSEARAQAIRAEAEAQMREILARAETRVQEIQARAEARVNHAEDRARAAEQRATAAEGWLKRIEEAAKSQLPTKGQIPTKLPRERASLVDRVA